MGSQVDWPVTKPHYKYGLPVFLPVMLLENLAQLFYEFVRKHESSNTLQGDAKTPEAVNYGEMGHTVHCWLCGKGGSFLHHVGYLGMRNVYRTCQL